MENADLKYVCNKVRGWDMQNENDFGIFLYW